MTASVFCPEGASSVSAEATKDLTVKHVSGVPSITLMMTKYAVGTVSVGLLQLTDHSRAGFTQLDSPLTALPLFLLLLHFYSGSSYIIVLYLLCALLCPYCVYAKLCLCGAIFVF